MQNFEEGKNHCYSDEISYDSVGNPISNFLYCVSARPYTPRLGEECVSMVMEPEESKRVEQGEFRDRRRLVSAINRDTGKESLR